MANSYILPAVPVKHQNFLNHVKSNPQASVQELVQPYNEYDAVLRKIYAQEPLHPAVADNLLNVVPLFGSNGEADLQIRARDLAVESEELKTKFLMPLKNEDRRPNGSPAVVSTLKDFQTNFNLFSESALSDLDWSNIVAAGSAVTTSLVPVPEQYRDSKRGLREFYHEKFAPASDVDLFLYGLTEEQAIEKIKKIETRIKDSILSETSTIRTKNAITIVSQYPTRHVQIVLRIYKSVAEILTGFDVDCSCAAYDGQQVYMAPRAVGAFVTQINHVDLTRRSPSYENRLSKYARRGFEVFWPMLDRSQVDPTIFERSFTRTVGLARLLVLEKLPKPSDRDDYIEKRRRERGRPVPARHWPSRQLRGNIKNDWDDEVPDWDDEQDVSDYHTFTIPYGANFHARKIERLLYTKDLLLNAEWNKPKDREVNLHRHPAFFGHFDDVIEDCCGFCPVPVTLDEKEISAEESKTYVSGRISFLKDNAGRQEIGSFNPITETDWTEMAYVGNTAGLCEAIVGHDLESVKEWLSQGYDVNRRDFTGRTPLHLAVMTSTPEIVQCLVDQGARLVARLADGRTALHLAAARGSVEMIKTLLTKSEKNEEEEEAKKEQARKETSSDKSKHNLSDSEDDGELISHHPESEADDRSFATGSFVKVKVKHDTPDAATESLAEDANEKEPDIYDINVIAWDNHASPLHLAIVNGHVAAVEELVSSFGADVLLPIKLLHQYNNTPRAAILTLVLALRLPMDQAKAMTAKLLQLGASPAQADLDKKTSVTYIAKNSKYVELLDLYLHHDRPAVERTINYISTSGWRWNPSAKTALTTAINAGNVIGALKLLEANANPMIDFDEFIKVAQENLNGIRNDTSDQVKKNFNLHVAQPIIIAVMKDQPSIARALLARGVDPNTLTPDAHRVKEEEHARSNLKGESVLDCVRHKLDDLRKYKPEIFTPEPPKPLEHDDKYYLSPFQEDTYQMWMARAALQDAHNRYKTDQKTYEESLAKAEEPRGLKEKKAAVDALLKEYEKLEAELIAREAKTFTEMYPDIKTTTNARQGSSRRISKPSQFKVSVDFQRPDLNDATREGYIQLFEAAWRGDLETIKILTMGMWGPESQSLPLEIATKDNRGFCPFHLAIMRGYLDIARAIIAIAEVQYKPEEKEENVRYRIRTETNDDDDSCCDSDVDEDREEFGIEKHILDDRFTIDNIGEVKTQVESKISPLSILQNNCHLSLFLPSPVPDNAKFSTLIQYAIWKDDVELLIFILELGRELTMRGPSSSEQSMFEVKEWDFTMAMRLGRLRCLKEIIKRTGAGLPLEKLAEQSGVEIKENPKFYQGLSIHGKKRADWAAAGRGITPTQPREEHPPLLLAARQGNVDTVEWFLGTAPARYYAEFAEAFKHDRRLKRLALGQKGIYRSITSWLDCRRELVLHCAILSNPTDESERLVRYLVKTVPQCLEIKSIDGYTPLALAFSLQNYRSAKILVEAGADQTARDKEGNNILHLLLKDNTHPSDERLKTLPEMLGLIHPSLVSSLLLERSSQDPGALTPLAQWMVRALSTANTHTSYGTQSNRETDNQMKTLEIILDFAQTTEQKHLEVLDGAGNTVMHDAVRCGLLRTLKRLLKRRPDLLHRENASGTTAAELAEAAWIAQVTANPPNSGRSNHSYYNTWGNGRYSDSLVHHKPETFLKKGGQGSNSELMIHNFCRKSSEGISVKRRLVTLFEANEVARRLASKDAPARSLPRHGSRRRLWANRNEEDFADEVQAWHTSLYQ